MIMKGVNFITNSDNEKVAVQIDLKLLEKRDSSLEDFIDGIIAESRINEERKPLEEVIDQLKKRGALK